MKELRNDDAHSFLSNEPSPDFGGSGIIIIKRFIATVTFAANQPSKAANIVELQKTWILFHC